MWLYDFLQQQFVDFTNPQKRIFWVYLLSAVLIGLAWLSLVRSLSIKAALSLMFSKKIWLAPSSIADIFLFFINKFIMLLLAPRLLGQITVATFLFYNLHGWLGAGAILSVSPLTASVLFTVVYFVIDDFSRFYLHRLLHKHPILWRFHKVHHSAQVLTPLTVFRTHPIEGVLFLLRSVLVQGALIGVFIFAYGDAVALWSIWGANVFVLVFNVVGANLRHSHIPVGYGRFVENILISPAQHQLHHSQAAEHHDKNFGVVFAVWDKLWGSLCLSQPKQKLRFGLGEQGNTNPHSLQCLYFAPIVGERAMNVIANYYHLGYRVALNVLYEICIGRYMNKLIAGVLMMSLYIGSAYGVGEVNVYSARKTELIAPLLDQFAEKAGIKVNLITGNADALLTRLRLEGKASPADVFITVDAGRLQRAKEAGILASISSPILESRIPEHLQDKDKQWFALSMRARPIFYVKGAVKPEELSTYEALADEKWRDRVCIRSSNNVYNQSLVGSMIEQLGEGETSEWAEGLVANFARQPAGGDTDQLKAAAAGVCDVVIANTYYYGRLINSKDAADREISSQLGLFWPNQKDRGAHVNVSGAGVTFSSKNPENAVALIEFLSSPEAQAWYAQVNNEYPVVKGAIVSDTLLSWGEFVADDMPLNKLGENNRRAVELMDRAGWK